MTVRTLDHDGRFRLLGSATTSRQTEIDPLDPARAVRRSLADAGRKALDVVAIAVSADLAASRSEARAFARLALGPHGVDVAVLSAGEGQLIDLLVTTMGPRELGIAVTHAAGTTFAYALERSDDESKLSRS